MTLNRFFVEQANEIFQAASESGNKESSQFTMQFWVFFLMMIISWVGQAVVVTFADAICFNLLGMCTSIVLLLVIVTPQMNWEGFKTYQSHVPLDIGAQG